jgi:hypothetical protein
LAEVEARTRESKRKLNEELPARLKADLPRREEAEEKKPREERKSKEQLKAEIREEVNAALALRYGVYTAEGVVVTDYHTQSFTVPAGLFKKLAEDAAAGDAPALQVLVTMEQSSGPQLLGVARRDLYFLAGEGWFGVNFVKGSIALWLGACLVLGLALALSTYLSGVISLLTAAFLCGASLFRDFITSLSLGRSFGGGPFESMYRLANRQGLVVELDPNATSTTVLRGLDDAYRWFLRRILSLIPDMSRFDLTTYVANGFDISWGEILFADTLLPLLGYLIPCGILAYYLMNEREIANPT